MSDPMRQQLTMAAVVLVVVSTVLQLGALAAHSEAIAPGTTGRHVFSTVEMALVVGLLVVGWRIVGWAEGTDQPALVSWTARACLASLALCALGDLVNRNYLEQSYQWDDVLRYSYLITAIWFFFPGYAVVVAVNRRITRSSQPTRVVALTCAAAAVVGLLAYASNHDPAMSRYSSTMIAAYTVLLTILGASTVWLVRAYGWRACWVPAVGCLLALVADALIGNFWIARDHFPTIEHVNWIPYFASLAMIQRLPFLVADHGSPQAHPVASPAPT